MSKFFLIGLLIVAGCSKKNTVIVNTIPNESWVETTTPVEKKTDAVVPVEVPMFVEKTITLETVLFDFDQAEIRPDQVKKLDRVVAEIGKTKTVVLHGHACEIGTAEYNLSLGERRAQVVREYLRQFVVGVEFEVESFGESQPVTNNKNEIWKNRRVEILMRGAFR